MRTNPINGVIDHLRRAVLTPDGAGLGDGELLGSFIERHDETALAALVRRHGPMVWGVCRRLLNHHDAEDAFQATFLVLVRKAASIRSREMVGNWLYGVAHQTALLARRTAARRRVREVQVTEMPDIEAVQQDQWPELRPLLDEELSRLPEIYRAVIVHCELEGRSRKETALQLGVPEGTAAGRLARARVLLAKRLAQRGVVVSGGALAAILTQNVASASVPASVVSNTIKVASLLAAGQAATGVIPVKVAALTEGVLKAMFLTKLKAVVVGVLMVAMCLIGVSTAVAVGQQPDSPKKPDEAKKAEANEVAVKAMQERLQGTWKCVSTHSNGMKSDLDIIYTIKGNTWETKLDGKVFQSGTFKLVDLDASPKQIEWVITFAEADEAKGKTIHGIFMLDGDSLCWNTCDAAKYPRPQAFFTEPDDGCCAGMFKRADPKKE
ncbi:MAG TPA: sigma-70 family RNA polymerase sigma factor [Gemmataceae bacterium]|jgi:RNA polymerase sigma factor (sigma-70 family)|nr:sigma-70 family RNA polymerase sigma factor [Gemmataceae bacterium]